MAIKRIPRLGDTATASDLAAFNALYTSNFTHTFTAAGRYRITAWGGGASGDPGVGGGGGGELVQIVRNFSVGDQVVGIVAARIGGDGIPSAGLDGNNSTLTLPDTTVITAHGGKTASNGGAGGTGGNGDINVNGSARSGTNGGAGASLGSLTGGIGDTGALARYPGGGGSAPGGNGYHGDGGLVLIVREA